MVEVKQVLYVVENSEKLFQERILLFIRCLYIFCIKGCSICLEWLHPFKLHSIWFFVMWLLFISVYFRQCIKDRSLLI